MCQIIPNSAIPNRELIIDEKIIKKTTNYCCSDMKNIMEDEAFDMSYTSKDDEIHLGSREGGCCWKFSFCPFCGKNINGKGDIFCDVIKKEFGIDVNDEDFCWSDLNELLPPEFQTDEWWKKRGF